MREPGRLNPVDPVAHDLVRLTLATKRSGDTISIKETIAAVRKLAPYLTETDCQLVEIIVSDAVVIGAFVAFDLHE